MEYVQQNQFSCHSVSQNILGMSLIVQNHSNSDSVLAAHANWKSYRHDCQRYDSVLVILQTRDKNNKLNG